MAMQLSKKKNSYNIVIIFLSISLNMCFGCSKVRDSSFEYPQHMFWLRNKKYNFQVHTLIWGPGFRVLSGSILEIFTLLGWVSMQS